MAHALQRADKTVRDNLKHSAKNLHNSPSMDKGKEYLARVLNVLKIQIKLHCLYDNEVSILTGKMDQDYLDLCNNS